MGSCRGKDSSVSTHLRPVLCLVSKSYCARKTHSGPLPHLFVRFHWRTVGTLNVLGNSHLPPEFAAGSIHLDMKILLYIYVNTRFRLVQSPPFSKPLVVRIIVLNVCIK